MRLPRLIAGILCGTAFAFPGMAADEDAAVPDFSGLWAREVIGFESPLSGPGPIASTSRIRTGQSNLNWTSEEDFGRCGL